MRNAKKKVSEEIVEEAAVTEETIEEAKIGIVTDCMNLNIRKAPDPDAGILCQITCLSEVLVDKAGSTDDFYKVCTAAGVDGFCMKRYIRIRQ